ncbi:HNH endonuclease [Streptomyces lavendulae]|uniref:HNH endonuclease n=1 Tax=Streptomyces lavendulae TaxID=1914 RepID=UPI003319B65D
MGPTDVGSLPPAVREAVLEAHCGGCTYCSWENAEEVDHVIPWDIGGRNDITNLVPACRSCNRSKGNRTVLQWRRDILARKSPPRFESLLVDRTFHDPNRVVDMTREGITAYVAEVQREVIEIFHEHEQGLAARLLMDLNRLVSRLGNLHPDNAELLRTEALTQLSGHGDLLLAEHGVQLSARWAAELRQIGVKGEFRSSRASVPTSYPA